MVYEGNESGCFGVLLSLPGTGREENGGILVHPLDAPGNVITTQEAFLLGIPSSHERFGQKEIFLCRDLDVVVVPFHNLDRYLHLLDQ